MGQVIAEVAHHTYITQDSNICGGEPIIRETRFPVRSVVFYILKEGMFPEELVAEFPHLSLSAVCDALSYYYDHTEEIERLSSFSEDTDE
ncbi:MAG: DUF433 domain-containing protein [bacterium]